jgi:hypothetical protein
MALCKYCGKTFAWGKLVDRWIPLIPVGEEGDLPRTYQDEKGDFRTAHSEVCVERIPTVELVKLAAPLEAASILPRLRPSPKQPNRAAPSPRPKKLSKNDRIGQQLAADAIWLTLKTGTELS